jgi:hypothetical protein
MVWCRSATITVGSAPKNSLVDWAGQINTPEIITKELRPLSDLFIDDFMKDILAMEHMVPMKAILAKNIDNYCTIFKEERRCNFVAGFEISLTLSRPAFQDYVKGQGGADSAPPNENQLWSV